jgi:probable phosphoglycerate mutase
VTRIVVIRHGETEWNVESRIQGQRDSALTAVGLEQARSLAQRLAAEEFDVLISSDLGRALDTARCVSAACAHEVVPDARLRERNFGVGEGLTYDEVGRAYPDAFSRLRSIDPDYRIPGGESRRAFHDRVTGAFESIAREHAGKAIVVVTHGGVLATLYRHVHGIGIAAPHRVPITNAAYNALSHDGRAFAVEVWDDTAHLPAADPFEED